MVQWLQAVCQALLMCACARVRVCGCIQYMQTSADKRPAEKNDSTGTSLCFVFLKWCDGTMTGSTEHIRCSFYRARTCKTSRFHADVSREPGLNNWCCVTTAKLPFTFADGKKWPCSTGTEVFVASACSGMVTQALRLITACNHRVSKSLCVHVMTLQINADTDLSND